MPKIVDDMIDAPTDLVVYITVADAMEAASKDPRKFNEEVACDPSGQRIVGCAGEVAFLRQYPQFEMVKIDATVACAKPKDPSKPTLRWILEGDGSFLTSLNDLGPHLLVKRIKKDGPLALKLISAIAPTDDDPTTHKRWTRSLAYHRLESTKKMKRESRERREREISLGSERQGYSSPTNRIGRSGRLQKKWFKRGE